MYKLKSATYQEINTTLFVGGFDHAITKRKLKKLFGKYGTVETIILNKLQLSNLSFGFIRMSKTEEARKCAEVLDNYIINGYPLMVRS